MADTAGTPTKECDVIMKGGITSGVVFPLAIYELSKQYRFVNLGGTSAGAIAAAVAAAAEYGRDKGGFDHIKAIPSELGGNLLKLFQPSPPVRPLFDMLIAASDFKKTSNKEKVKSEEERKTLRQTAIRAFLKALLAGYKIPIFQGIALGAAIFLIALLTHHWGWAAFGLLAALVGGVVMLGLALFGTIVRDIPANDYGFCTGATQDEKGYGHTAVTEWLGDTIDECAGLQPGGRPLTFGDLKKPPSGGKPIILEMMTTNLSMKRPYRLPFRDRVYLYRPEEMGKFFPKRVMDYMLTVSPPLKKKDGSIVEGYLHVPSEDDLPVIFATRLSLSFPFLFTIMPLYARDFTLMGDQEANPQRCLFTDGGLSNNFPIQFFDRLWPDTPTFGIGLDEYNKNRDRNNSRIFLPKVTSQDGKTVTSGALLPINDVIGLPAFLTSILFTAKDWQDNLQSTLHGYRERIVHVALTPDEGGLNLTMSSDTIGQLSEYGAQAGDKLNTAFNLDEHRWRRFLVAMRRVESTLFELQHAYENTPIGADSFKDFLYRYPPQTISYKPDPAALQQLRERAEALVKMADVWTTPSFPEELVLKPESDLRITPQP
jgi:predicted acylesterase/phospholipase RssA